MVLEKAAEVEPAEGLSIAMALFLASIQQQNVSLDDERSRKILLWTVMTGCIAVVALLIERVERQQKSKDVLAAITKMVYEEFYNQNNWYRLRKRGIENNNDDGNNTRKKRSRKTRHDHERAWMCIQQDYLGPDPIFTDKQFEEVRLTKSCVERVIQACVRYEPETFNPGPDATGKPPIRVEVKVLAVLKCIAFGCSGVAFRDYHQMGRNTTTECIKKFFSAILADDDLRGTYLRCPTRADAKRITALHKEKHGVDGMLAGKLGLYARPVEKLPCWRTSAVQKCQEE